MPRKSIADTNCSLAGPLTRLSLFPTPQRFRKTERKVFTACDFDDVLRSVAKSQFDYIGWPRSNSVRVRGAWFETLAPSHAHLLGAANVEARIRFARTAVHEALRHLEEYEGPVFFFSVCPRRWVAPLRDAHRVDLHGLKKLTGQVFSGCSLVGSVDFALFKGFGKGGIRAWHNKVGAHTHGLLWGATYEQLMSMLAAMGPDFTNVKGECAGYVQQIAPEEIAGYMRYAMKLPLCEYNVKANDKRFDPETGEILREVTVSTNPLRPGDQLRLSALLYDMHLDHLVFGQHEGTGVAREIRRRARLPLMWRNEVAERRNRPPNEHIGTEEISRWKRTAVAKLIQNPPKRVWLGPRPSVELVEPFMSGRTIAGVANRKWSTLSEVVFN